MRRLVLLAGLVIAGLLAALDDSAAAAPKRMPWCADTTDETAGFMIRYLRTVASNEDSLFAETRDSLAFMPRVSQAEVVLVGDEVLCERASRALDTSFFSEPRGAPVYLARVGARYAVHPPDVSMGEFGYLVFTDSLFQKLAVSTF